MEEGEEALTSAHVRSEAGEWADSDEARISPILRVPKKAHVDAAQKTCFVRGSQSVAAILEPRFVRSGKVTTLLVFEDGIAMEMCSAPFKSWDIMKSSEIWWQEKPLRLCTNFMPERYNFIDEWESFRTEWHQMTKDLQVSMSSGHVDICFASFSKQAKAFKAEEYFAHDDFDKEEFMSCE
jgi:hypothetical protein